MSDQQKTKFALPKMISTEFKKKKTSTIVEAPFNKQRSESHIERKIFPPVPHFTPKPPSMANSVPIFPPVPTYPPVQTYPPIPSFPPVPSMQTVPLEKRRSTTFPKPMPEKNTLPMQQFELECRSSPNLSLQRRVSKQRLDSSIREDSLNLRLTRSKSRSNK